MGHRPAPHQYDVSAATASITVSLPRCAHKSGVRLSGFAYAAQIRLLAWLRIDPPNVVTIHTISRMTAKIGSRAREEADTVTIQVSVGQWGNRLLWSPLI